eukprot:162149-Pelagomonas_calceolata.AAC.4
MFVLRRLEAARPLILTIVFHRNVCDTAQIIKPGRQEPHTLTEKGPSPKFLMPTLIGETKAPAIGIANRPCRPTFLHFEDTALAPMPIGLPYLHSCRQAPIFHRSIRTLRCRWGPLYVAGPVCQGRKRRC